MNAMHRCRPFAVRTALTALCVIAAAGCAPETEPDEEAVNVGLLLPFTGTSSATSSNFERAAMFAAGRVNAAGGIHGKPLRIIAADTHSELGRAERAIDELLDRDIEVLIGPESADIAAAIAQPLAERGVVFLSPLIGAANDESVDCSSPWFRLAPSARKLGEALAKELDARAVESVAVLYAGDAYNEALRSAAAARFVTLGGSVALELELDPNAQSYASAVRDVLEVEVDAILLATSPRTGALVVNEMDALSRRPPKWFLSPLLKTELLVQNVAPAALEGAVGVAPRIYDTTSAFPSSFSNRWDGDQPLEGAYFYYDAVALLSFALQKHEHVGGAVDAESLVAAIVDVAATRGEAYRWNELERGLDRLRDGVKVNYTGLTGPMLLQDCGSRQLGATTIWEVASGSITEVD
jgi:branched-chain amino acid transport system substrate-binding protein